MHINVSQLLISNIGTERNHNLDETIEVNGFGIDFNGSVMLMKTDRGILAKGNFKSRIDQDCSRCLCSFSYPLNLIIEEEYFPLTDIMTGTSIPTPDEPGSFIIDDHNILDLSEAIRQYAVLAIPIKPLCKQKCAGLCSACGTNLNETTCDCPEEIDPRWEKLKNLL